MALGHRVRDAEMRPLPSEARDTGERYDLVVVGAGLAGLAAAYVYHRERKGRCRILLLDAAATIGGHARRNRFDVDGTTLVAAGGTFALEEPDASPPEALEVLKELGVDAATLEAYRDPEFKRRFGLSQGVFFDPRVWPGASPRWVNGFYTIPYERFFAQAPIPEAARRELLSFYTTREDYLPGLTGEAREEALAAVSWEQFIRERMRLGDEAVRFANLYATDLVGLGCDAVSALAGYNVGPGFAGMGGEGFVERNGILAYAYEPTARFPDGNHTLARALLKRVRPDAVSGRPTMEGDFLSELDEAAFDGAAHGVRVRLRSLAYAVRHEGPTERPSGVVVDYLDPSGAAHRVRASGAVVAAWGMAARRIVPGLPEAQQDALAQYAYTSAIYVNVLLRHWRPIADLGVFDLFLPGGYFTWGHIADPLRVGSYTPEYHPDRPTVLSLYKYIHTPGLSPREQAMLGRIEMESKSFEEYEREIRRELDQLFGPFGLRVRDDVLGLAINRWGHGYCFFRAPGEGPSFSPWEQGRARFGRISFAGADAGGGPWSQNAIQEGRRAALEQL